VSPSNLVFVHADAGQMEGWGHLRESIEVAHALRAGGAECVFVLPAAIPAAQEEARAAGFEVAAIPAADWQAGAAPQQLVALLNARPGANLVCDLFAVSPAYATAVTSATRSWACITEVPSDELAPLNFNISTEPGFVPLGAEYRGASPHPITDEIAQILVCYGGSDPRNVTGKTLEWLRTAIDAGALPKSARIVVVMGPLFTHHEAVRASIADYPLEVDLHSALAPTELMQAAIESDIAITTSGGTMYEFSALGLPCLVVPILDKHITNARVLEQRGVVLTTRLHNEVSAEQLTEMIQRIAPVEVRRTMSQAAQQAIDGEGTSRIAERLIREWGIG
jgi:spore coat polysaccharide biosynthesis predicted glycosyltransferase SpsG